MCIISCVVVQFKSCCLYTLFFCIPQVTLAYFFTQNIQLLFPIVFTVLPSNFIYIIPYQWFCLPSYICLMLLFWSLSYMWFISCGYTYFFYCISLFSHQIPISCVLYVPLVWFILGVLIVFPYSLCISLSYIFLLFGLLWYYIWFLKPSLCYFPPPYSDWMLKFWG